MAFSPAFSLADEDLDWNTSFFFTGRPAGETLWGECMLAGTSGSGETGAGEGGAGEFGLGLAGLGMKNSW